MSKETETPEVGIGMIVQVTKPIEDDDDKRKRIGEVADFIKKPGMRRPLWGIDFTADEGLHWYWGSELTVVAALGRVDDVDAGEALSRAVDNMAHEIIGLAIDDLNDAHPGISKHTIIGSKAGGQRLIDLLEETFTDWHENLDR